MSLKQKTISGLTWSFIDNFSNIFLSFIVGIILARLLSPAEFGLIGMITVFTAISQSFIDSGFGEGLIRKKNCSQEDYCTVFYFNLFAGVILFLILFFSAGAISRFYNQPQLLLLTRVLILNFIISSFGLIQRTILTKNLNFKFQTRLSLTSTVVSGIVGIILAYTGFGVWSLVIRSLLNNGLNVLFYWLSNNRWVPTLVFSFDSFKSLFSFGFKVFIGDFLEIVYKNIYLLIIGKYFSVTELGYYTRADLFKNLPSQNLNGVIQRVSYPVLASIQDNPSLLKAAYKKLITSTMLISFVLMFGMAAIAKPLVLTLIGYKWMPSIIYLQLLCFVGMFYPLNALNINMLKVVGRSDLILKLEIIKKILIVPVIIIGIMQGIKTMIIGMIILSVISYFLNSYWSGHFINYSMRDQVRDIMPSFYVALVTSVLVLILGLVLSAPNIVILISQILLIGVLIFIFSHLFQLDSFFYVKDIFVDKFLKRGNSE